MSVAAALVVPLESLAAGPAPQVRRTEEGVDYQAKPHRSTRRIICHIMQGGDDAETRGEGGQVQA